jgi:hypothetical protein
MKSRPVSVRRTPLRALNLESAISIVICLSKLLLASVVGQSLLLQGLFLGKHLLFLDLGVALLLQQARRFLFLLLGLGCLQARLVARLEDLCFQCVLFVRVSVSTPVH